MGGTTTVVPAAGLEGGNPAVDLPAGDGGKGGNLVINVTTVGPGGRGGSRQLSQPPGYKGEETAGLVGRG